MFFNLKLLVSMVYTNIVIAVIDFSRQILASKLDTLNVRVKQFLIAVDPYHICICIHMNQTEPTKEFMMISN